MQLIYFEDHLIFQRDEALPYFTGQLVSSSMKDSLNSGLEYEKSSNGLSLRIPDLSHSDYLLLRQSMITECHQVTKEMLQNVRQCFGTN